MKNVIEKWPSWFNEIVYDESSDNIPMAIMKARLALGMLNKEKENGDFHHDMNLESGKEQIQILLNRLKLKIKESIISSEILDIRRRAVLL